MAINKTRLAGGGEIGTVTAKNKTIRIFGATLKVPKINKFFLITACLMVTLVFGVVIYSFKIRKSNTQSTNSYAQEFTNSNNSKEVKQDLVKKYGETNEQSYRNIIKSNPSKWSTKELDQACASLLYADKMGDYQTVNTILSYIYIAEQHGISIQQNTHGVDQKMIDQIKQRSTGFKATVKDTNGAQQ